MWKTYKTYPGGVQAVIQQYESRRDPFTFEENPLPPLTVNLSQMREQLITEEHISSTPVKAGSHWGKRKRVAREFIGNSELALLNAILIANLRRRAQPKTCSQLFQRLWREESDHLINVLDMRWKVSSVVTFADHGITSTQRELGRGLHVMFGMMKLYEFERTFSRAAPTQIWSPLRRKRTPLPLEMEPYSLTAGGLDTAILAPLWKMATEESVMGPLCCHLLDALNSDQRNVFARLAKMRDKQLEHAATLEPADPEQSGQNDDKTQTSLGDRVNDQSPKPEHS